MDLTEDDWKGLAEWIDPAQRAAFAQSVAELTPVKGVLGDLALAFAACHGHLKAQRLVEKTLRESRQNVARIEADPSFLDEVHQVTLTRLLSPPNPRLASYSGLGPLGAWLRATAVRVAIDLRRGSARERPEEHLESLIHVGPGRTDNALRGLTSAQVAEAIRKALDTLSSRDRMLLRLHYFEGTTLEALARMYTVHRATVARWLAEAREVVLAQTRLTLSSRAGGDELEEVLGSVQSQLDISFRQIFEKIPGD